MRNGAQEDKMTGIELIAAEHDDGHTQAELADAGACYADLAAYQAKAMTSSTWVNQDWRTPMGWPWGQDGSWRPSSKPIRNLEKAGAFIAAEIDRLLRAEKEVADGNHQ